MVHKSRLNSDVDKIAVRHFLDVSRQQGADFYLSWLPTFSAVGINTIVPFFLGKILAGVARPGTPLTKPVIGFIVAGATGIILNRIAFISLLRLQANVMAKLQLEAVNALLYRGTSFHNNQVGGKLVSDALDYPQAYLRLSDTVVVNILPFVGVLLVGIVILLIQAPIIALTVLLMAGLAITTAIIFRLSMAKYRHMRIEAQQAVTAHVADIISNIHTVKSFARESEEMATGTKLTQTLENFRQRDWYRLAINGNNRIIGLFMFESLFIVTMIHQIHAHPQLLAAGIFAFSYTVTLTNRMFDIGNMMRAIEESLLLAEPMTVILQQDHEVKDLPDATELRVTKGAVTLRDVQFVYHDNPSAQDVFIGLNISVKPGERVGLVGPSGGGKSTLTKLLLRFEDLANGTIEIDGQDIAKVTQRSLRESIGYVSQEPLLFHRSVKENIAYGNMDATDAEIEAAAKKAFAHDFIVGLPKGYDTVVGERGVKLSGGQRQRVAIARAILKDASILILDEATSALDSESEKYIQDALWHLMEGKTAIVIAHRLSTIQRLDRIIVLDEGKIIEDGTHAELLKKKGLYAKLWAHQSGGFMEE